MKVVKDKLVLLSGARWERDGLATVQQLQAGLTFAGCPFWCVASSSTWACLQR